MTVSFCSYPGCHTLTGNGRCNAHTKGRGDGLATLKPRVQTLTNRLAIPLSQTPDYRIRGRELQRIREEHLRKHPLCVRCTAKGLVSVATELDHPHPLSKGGTDTPDNRQGLCHACHQAKTLEDLKG